MADIQAYTKQSYMANVGHIFCIW